eukprot:ctg_4614.g462
MESASPRGSELVRDERDATTQPTRGRAETPRAAAGVRRRGRWRSSEAVRNVWSRATETRRWVRDENVVAKSDEKRMRRKVTGNAGGA